MSAFILQTVRVQPNDGFGTILPHEKIDLYLYFSPEKAEVIYNCFRHFVFILYMKINIKGCLEILGTVI